MSEHAGPPHGPGPNHGGQHPGPVVDPRRSDDRFRPRPQNPQRTAAPPPMRRQAPGPGPDLGLRIPPPGQMTRPGHQSHPGQPMQSRVYEQPRFAPTVTQEMRVRAQMQPPQHRVAETPWTGAVRRTPEPAEPGSPGNVVRLVLAILAVCALVFGLLVMAIWGGFSFGARLFGLIGLSAIPLIGIIA